MERIKCEECGGKIVKKKIDFAIYGEKLGKFTAEVCTKCGEELFDEVESDKIDEAAKEKGLWGLDAKTRVTKAGSSMAITIQKKIANFMQLQQGEEVYVHPESRKRLVIEVS